MQKTTPSKTEGVEIELPNFDELFNRIREVSPLCNMAIDGELGGFDVADEKCKCNTDLASTRDILIVGVDTIIYRMM